MTTESTVLHARTIGLDSGILGLTLFPTEKCNFRCVYCYETFPNIHLHDTIATSICKLIEHRSKNDLHTLNIGWFGGEPLLQHSILLKIARFAHDLSIKRGFTFTSHITTNGYLLHFALFED